MKDKIFIECLLFVLTFVVVFIIYKITNGGVNSLKKKPNEIRLLEGYFKVDISKLSYKWLLNSIALISSFDVAFIVTISCISKFTIIRLLVALITIIPVMFLSYLAFSKYCIRKIKKEGRK